MKLFRANRRNSLLAAVVGLIAVAWAGVAISQPVSEPENAPFVGTFDSGRELARSSGTKSTKGSPAQWGVFHYQSDPGLTCLQAGVVVDGVVGSFTAGGFRSFSPRDGIGNCGELDQTLDQLGGAIFGASAPASTDMNDRTSLAYGLLAPRVTAVHVTTTDSKKELPVEITEVSGVPGVDRVFIAPIESAALVPAITITYQLGDSEMSASTM